MPGEIVIIAPKKNKEIPLGRWIGAAGFAEDGVTVTNARILDANGGVVKGPSPPRNIHLRQRWRNGRAEKRYRWFFLFRDPPDLPNGSYTLRVTGKNGNNDISFDQPFRVVPTP